MACRDGRPRGADERVRADGKRDHVRRTTCRPPRARTNATCRSARRCRAPPPMCSTRTCNRCRRCAGASLPGRQCARERLSGPARADGGRLPARSVRRPAGRAHVSHRRPRASRYGRRTGLPRPQRSPDQGARDSRRPGRGGGAAARPGRRARGGGAAVEQPDAPAPRLEAFIVGPDASDVPATSRDARAAACVAPRGAGAPGAARAGHRAVAAQDVR